MVTDYSGAHCIGFSYDTQPAVIHEAISIRDRGFDSATLLSHPDVIPLTLKFVTETGRFPRHTVNPTQVFHED